MEARLDEMGQGGMIAKKVVGGMKLEREQTGIQMRGLIEGI